MDVIRIALVGVLLLAAGRAAWLAWVDHLFRAGTKESVGRAAALAPGNTACALRLADLLEETGQDSVAALRAAVAASPYDAQIRVRAGLQAEMDGDLAGAEKLLLEAARLSRKFEPRWTLANFYFRREQAEPFWRWAKESLAIWSGDPFPVFDLCWRIEPDADAIRARVILDRRPVEMDYARFLMAREQWTPAAALVAQLAQGIEPAQTEYFLWACDRLLEQNRIGAAKAVWNALQGRGWIPRARTLGRGFDWRVAAVPGVSVAPSPPEGWKILFDGSQPERCEILSRILALEGGHKYRVHYRYRADLSSPGMMWRLYSATRTLGECALAQEQACEVWVPAGVEAVRLALEYERARGSTRAEGSLRLQRVSVTIAE